MSRPIRVALTMAQVVAALLCVMVLTGWRGPGVVNELAGFTYWPWQSIITTFAFGVIAVSVSVGAVRSPFWRRMMLSSAAVVLTLLAVDALPLHSARGWLVAGAMLCTVAGLIFPLTRAMWEVIRCVVVFVPFAMAMVATLRSTGVDQALAAIRARSLTPEAAIGLSMLAIFAIASAIQEQRERSDRLLTWHITRRAIIVAAIAKVALMLALYLHLTGDFLGGEMFWRPRLNQPLSWLHAAIVAGIIAFVAAMSTRRPVATGGFTARLGVLTLTLGVMQAAALGTSVLTILVNAVAPTADTTSLATFPSWVIDHSQVLQLATVVVLFASAIVTVIVRRRLTSGTYLWLVSGTWLIPPLLGIAFASESTPTAWAAPGQVDAVLTVVVLVMVVTRLPKVVPPRALMGLLLVPLVVLHLDSFWPGAWTQHLAQVAIVAGAIIALWLNPPPMYADPVRNERVRALLLAGNLTVLALYMYLLNDATLADGPGSSGTLALLWLGVPITAVLTARTRERDPAWTARPGGVQPCEVGDVGSPREGG
ncbi:MAG: hypothetical protein ABI662_06700 [Dermatophilaceae bacterium]